MSKADTEMEGTRRHKDRSYRNVFKGSVLVGTLLDHDNGRFINRQAAVKFAQRLLDAGHIESIVGASTFEDSVHLYRWSDETVVREAKRMVSTTSSHIPRKKLIEMIDLNQVEDSEESFVMEDVKDKLFKKQNERAPPKTKEESDLLAARRARHRERARRRQTMDGSQLSDASTAVASYKDKERERGREKEKDKEREKDREKERDPESDSALHRTESVSSDTSGLSAITDNSLRMRTGSPSSAGVSESRRASNNSVTEVLEMRLRSPETTTVTSVASVAIVPSSSTSPTPSRAESVQSSSESTKTESTVLPDVSTCRYDGIEMPALDLDNISFETVRTRKNKTSMKALHRSLEDLAEQSHSYSDNEKQLLEQMKKMQQEHENVVNTYEDQINELMGKMDDLKILSQALETERKESASGTISPSPFPGVAALDLQTDGLVSRDSLSPGPMSPVGKGPPGPPVPPPPPPPAGPPRLAKPTKPPLKPRVKMRPLFWNRIILEPLRDKDKEQSEPTFWHTSTEPNFDVDEFEKLFGKDHQKELKKTKSLHDAMSTMKGKGRIQTAKILEENRSRQVAIKLLSMHCQMQDIRNAVYTMDFSKIDLESLYRLYEIRGTAEEVDKISLHIQANEDVPLDQPEQFLLELSQMSHFPERMECMMLRKRFNETLFNIDQQLSTVQQACSEIKNSEMLKTLLEFVLAFGNYMNGGTQRGQADGFDLSIMCKLKDVKSMDNNTNLLRHIVKIYMREYEEDAGKNEAVFKLPDPAVLQQAAQVSFTDLDSDLNRLYHQLNTHSKKAELVCLDTDSELLQPFKDHMDDFFDTAEDMVKRQHQKLNNTKGTFQDQLRYMAVKDTTEQVTPDSFFSIFYQFIEDYKMFWKAEQKGIARDMFTKVEQKRKARMRSAKRRKSVIEDGKSNLKQKFAQMRKRSEGVTGQAVKFLRSQSVTSGIETDGSLRGSNESLASLAEDTQPPRRRRARSDIYEPRLVDENSNNPKTLNRMGSQEGKESMAERMRTRRRTRVSVEEMPATTRQESVPQRIRSRQTAAESPAAESNHDEPAPPAQRIRSRQPAAESSAAESNHEEPPSAERAYTRRRRSNQSIEDTGPGPNATDAAKSDVESMGPRRRRPTREDPAAAVDTDTTDDTSNQRTHYRRRRGSQDIRASHERPLLPSSPPPTGPPPHYMTRARSSQGNIFEDGQGTHHQRSSRASSPGRSSGRSSPELKVHNPRVRPAPLESDTDYDTDTASKIHYREALRKISRTQTGMFDQFSAVRVNREVSERKPEGMRERTRSRGESDKDTTAAPPWRSGRTRAGSFDA